MVKPVRDEDVILPPNFYKKSDYILCVHPDRTWNQAGGVRFILDGHTGRYLDLGFVELGKARLISKEEKELFCMLYPSLDLDYVSRGIRSWNHYQGKLSHAMYLITEGGDII